MIYITLFVFLKYCVNKLIVTYALKWISSVRLLSFNLSTCYLLIYTYIFWLNWSRCDFWTTFILHIIICFNLPNVFDLFLTIVMNCISRINNDYIYIAKIFFIKYLIMMILLFSFWSYSDGNMYKNKNNI